MPGRVVLLEFNELSPEPMHRFIREGKLPSFEQFYRQAQVFTTDAEENGPNLEPWIQWITVHTGLSYREHGVFNLGDAYNVREKSLWDLVSDHGGRVWVCGSMNVQYHLPIRGWVLPDPWMTKVTPQPADELQAYCRFVSANVLDYTRGRVPLAARETLAFVRFMARHGLSGQTVAAIASQLVTERMGLPSAQWKRSAILDRLQFDLFRWVYRRERPAFSTFFSNSTAHFQHLYWRNMQPERFQVKPTAGEQTLYEHAILYGYQQMDRLLHRFLDLGGDDTTLVLCTALSQQPCVEYEELGGKRWYRPRHFEQFLRDIGIAAPFRVSPVMAHEFHIDFETEHAAKNAEVQLGNLCAPGGEPAMMFVRTGPRIFAGCQVFEEIPPNAVLTIAGTERSLPFFQLFYRVDGLKSGMHHPDGMLWIREPKRRHRVDPVKVPLTSVAPTLLDMLGVPAPAYMKGQSILSRLG